MKRAGTQQATTKRTKRPKGTSRMSVAVITGSRSEFGLLDPVIAALQRHGQCQVQVIAAGEHLLGRQPTKREVAAKYAIAAEVRLHGRGGLTDRGDYARGVARGIEGFTTAFMRLQPRVVVVLGDRIEAFAGAIAANLLGLRVCHIHAGDVAEGIADEAMRHAISRLAHAHACATEQAARRMVASGEVREFVRVTGSPAIDALAEIPPVDEGLHASLGSPRGVILLHPSGLDERSERRMVQSAIDAAKSAYGRFVLCLQPNFDPGREVIAKALAEAAERYGWQMWPHLPRPMFVGLLKRLAMPEVDGALIGNSSAGIIEAGAIGVRVINIGPRQTGRERGVHVVDVPLQAPDAMQRAIAAGLAARVRTGGRKTLGHPFGDGHASEKIAALAADLAKAAPEVIRKRLTI